MTALLGGTTGVYLQYRLTAFEYGRAELNLATAEQRRIEAESAKQTAEIRQKDLERAIGNMAYLVGIIDLDQLFNLRMLHVDRELLQPALEANQRFLEEHQDESEREPEIVAAMYRVALLTRMIGDRSKALSLGQESLLRQEQFVAANPEVAQYKRDLAASYHNVGFLLNGAGKSDDALAYLRKARRIREEFVEAQPENLDYRSELAGCLNDIGLVWVARNEQKSDPSFAASAEQALTAARDHQRTVVQKAGHVPRYRTLLGNHLFNLGRLYALSGRVKEAIATADEMQRTAPFESDAKVRASRIYALASVQAGDEEMAFENRAVDLLMEGLASASADEAMALVIPDFQPLAKRDEYRQLRKRFGIDH
jgi:tetratricopeptide (TPR) repeat protein